MDQSLNGREAYISMHAISMVLEGEQHIRTYEGEMLTIKAGNLALFRKGIYSISDLTSHSGQFRSFLIFFEENTLSKYLKYLPFVKDKATNSSPKGLHVFLQPSYCSHFIQSVEMINKAYPSKAEELFPLKFKELFSILTTEETFTERLLSLSSLHEGSLIEFMEKNFDKPLSIEDYAYLTGRSESTFRREFKSKYDSTPRKWIIQRRMEKARRLLSETNWEVGRISLEVGYENTSHFISEFKKHYGYTPGKENLKHIQISDRKTAS